MTVAERSTGGGRTGALVRALAVRGLALAGAFWVLAGDGFVFGLVVGLGSAGLSLWLSPPAEPAVRLWRWPRFAIFFLGQSVRAGFVVAWMVLTPKRSLRPAIVAVPVDLPEGAPTVWLMLLVSLMPGTISLRRIGHAVEVHCLDVRRDVEGDVIRAAREVALLFGHVRRVGGTA